MSTDDEMHEDQELDAALRELAGREDPARRRPTEAVIRAYVRGEATEEQVEEVRTALLGSASFREELVARSMIEHEGDRFSPGKMPPVPPRRGASDSPPPVEPRKPNRFLRILPLRPRILLPAGLAAAALLAVLLADPFGVREGSLPGIPLAWEAVSHLQPRQFRAGPPVRGGEPDAPAYTTPAGAATQRFRELVTWDGERYTLGAPEPSPAPAGGRELEVHLVAGSRAGSHPVTLPEGAEDPEVVLLLLPSLEHRTAPVPPGADTVRLEIDPGGEDAAVITVSYETADGPGAAPAWAVRFRD